MTIADVKSNLTAQLHGSTLNKVRDIEMLFERAANIMLSKIDPIDTERTTALSQTIHDDFYNYSLPSDYKDIIDLIPQDARTLLDTATRRFPANFDLRKALQEKTVAIEGSEGSKYLRVNWRSRGNKTLNTMDSLTANGSWSVVGSASGLQATTIYKVSGSGSIEFSLVASGDGIQNTSMTRLDLTDENGVADIFVWIYFGSVSNLTSITAVWGNDLTANYWTATAQTTQADGTAFRVGWNLVKFSWSTATQTGTVVPSTIDSFKLTVAATGAISNIRVDNIVFSIGRPFDIKYYSKYIIKNSAGTWISRTTDPSDIIVLDNDALEIFHLEALICAAQQLEGTDSVFDISYAKMRLNGDPTAADISSRHGLYTLYRKRYPSASKKITGSYGSRRPDRGRFI